MQSSDAQTHALHVGERIARLAAEHPDRVAVVVIDSRGNETSLTWEELDRQAHAAAWGLLSAGVGVGTIVGVALPPGFAHVSAVIGSWRLGATVVPLNPNAGERERRNLKGALGGPIVGTGPWADIAPTVLDAVVDVPPVPSRGVPRSATVSGGSTGDPRLVVRDRPWMIAEPSGSVEEQAREGSLLGVRQLVVLPLYHAGFSALYKGLALDNLVVLLTPFRADAFFEVIERHRIQYVQLVPSYMRMALEISDPTAYDFTSIIALHHGSASCPTWLKRRWIDLLGAERIHETYASTERVGVVGIRGDEWLRHPGSVGRPMSCSVRILDDDGQDMPVNEVGLIFLRNDAPRQPEYLGPGAPLREQDNYYSVGDLGYLDEEGYLYLVDRKQNVINSGSIDIYPAEIEATLLEHPKVADAVVVGREHAYLGQALHAIVVPRENTDPPSTDELECFCRTALATAKVPLTYEVRPALPRTEAGKLDRRAL